MSDPRTNPPRMSEPKNSNTMYYVIGGLIIAAIAAYLFASSGTDISAVPTTSEAPATTQTEPAAPAAPAVTAPAEPAPAVTAPAEPAPAVTPPVTPPAAPANP